MRNRWNRPRSRRAHVVASAMTWMTALAMGAEPGLVPVDLLTTLPGLEVTVWASTPQVRNPTNMDVDSQGRLWVAEGINYRGHYNRQPEGDRIVVLQDTTGDGRADRHWTFVQEPFLRAPMGVAVIGNKVVVSMTPDLVVYTDVDGDAVFNPAVDRREVLLSGFNGRVHDHSLHSVTVGPDGWWYWNAGNCGALFTDRSGRTFRMGSAYDFAHLAGQRSDDGHVYVGGFAARMRPDGTSVQIIGHNFRNSYEQTVNSFGDVFQNDNDDPPACRTSFLLEYGNAGFASADGQRSWQADRRPGQSTPVAHWRQEDPGTLPPGDVYGGGSPTGIAYYEHGALGEGRQGLLLSCEPGRNTVFGYFPVAEGAGYRLERFDFLTSNQTGEYAGTDFKGGAARGPLEPHLLFRPSDVVVGADGAIYVSDWYDPRVGGHQALDDSMSGTIYRVAPKGFVPQVPSIDWDQVSGQMAALQSPAVNVRGEAFRRLSAQGEAVFRPVMRLLQSEDPVLQARALWLLPHLGPQGVRRVQRALTDEDPRIRVTAFRALRRAEQPMLGAARRLATDPSPMVRREVALYTRNLPFAESRDVLIALARGYDGVDRTYLEAWGIGCTGKEADMYRALLAEWGHPDPLAWSPAQAQLAWRLHPPASADAFRKRAMAGQLPEKDRRAALVALGHASTSEAAHAIADVAVAAEGWVKADAIWWLLNRKGGPWKEYGLDERLRRDGIYDPDTLEIIEAVVPVAEAPRRTDLTPLLGRSGNPARGKDLATSCQSCHRIAGVGVEYGPDLTAFGRMQPAEVILRAIVDPSADIAHGYQGTEIVTKDGVTIHGILMSAGDPLMIHSAGGVTQAIPAARVADRRGLGRSLMLSADQLGLGDDDLVDLVAYLKSL